MTVLDFRMWRRRRLQVVVRCELPPSHHRSSLRGLALAIVVLAVACHGGGGGSPQPTAPTVPMPAGNPGLACGVERWFVKTLADADADKVNLSSVTPISIRDLNGFPSHCYGGPDRRTYPEEFEVYEVIGRITYVRLEDDRDYHIALADPGDSSYTIVTEVADIACQGAVSSPHRGALETARNAFVSLLGGRSPSSLVGTTVRVRGVGFFDFNHGQNGRARNCMELHPIVSIDRMP